MPALAVLPPPTISSAGLGCSDASCIWLAGSNFGRSCQIAFYDPNWLNGSVPIQTVTANCTSTSASVAIPPAILRERVKVFVSVINRDSTPVQWSSPYSVSISESLSHYSLGIGEPVAVKAVLDYQSQLKSGKSKLQALTAAKATLTQRLQKLILLKPKSFRVWIDSRDLSQSLPDYADHLSLYKQSIKSLLAAGIDIIAMDQMTDSQKWLNHDLAQGTNWWLLKSPCPNSTEYSNYLVRNWTFWNNLAKQFPEINRWEVGNETNTDGFLLPNSSALNRCTSNGYFTLAQKAIITTDLVFYAKEGIKHANSKALVFFPGIAGTDKGYPASHIKSFLTTVYSHIASLGMKNRNFYDGLAWHPYWNSQNFLTFNRAVINFAKANGDANIPIWLTEFGYSIDEQNKDLNQVGTALRLAMNTIQTGLPEVESAIIYRGIADPNIDGFLLLNANLQRTAVSWAFCNASECQKDSTNLQIQAQRDPYVGLVSSAGQYFWTNGFAACKYQNSSHAIAATGTSLIYATEWGRLPSYLAGYGSCPH